MTQAYLEPHDHSSTPWSYEYAPYSMRQSAWGGEEIVETEIPAFEVYDADGNKIFDTNEDSPESLQEANARLAVAAPKMLSTLRQVAEVLSQSTQGIANAAADLLPVIRAIIAETEGGE